MSSLKLGNATACSRFHQLKRVMINPVGKGYDDDIHQTPDHDFGRSCGEVEGTFWCKRRNRHSSESESWSQIEEKRVQEIFYRYLGHPTLRLGYKVPGFKKSINNTVFNLFAQVLARVPAKYSEKKPNICQLQEIPSFDSSLAGYTPTTLDRSKSTPDFGKYRTHEIDEKLTFHWSSLTYVTDNGFEFGNMSIRQSVAWGILSYKLYQYRTVWKNEKTIL